MSMSVFLQRARALVAEAPAVTAGQPTDGDYASATDWMTGDDSVQSVAVALVEARARELLMDPRAR
jgi:hypothetical protein